MLVWNKKIPKNCLNLKADLYILEKTASPMLLEARKNRRIKRDGVSTDIDNLISMAILSFLGIDHP